jgi:hypothetical protein
MSMILTCAAFLINNHTSKFHILLDNISIINISSQNANYSQTYAG